MCRHAGDRNFLDDDSFVPDDRRADFASRMGQGMQSRILLDRLYRGQVAGMLNIPTALVIATICLYIGIAVSWCFYVGTQDKADLPLSFSGLGRTNSTRHRNGRRTDHGHY